jgi:hypothetical protein
MGEPDRDIFSAYPSALLGSDLHSDDGTFEDAFSFDISLCGEFRQFGPQGGHLADHQEFRSRHHDPSESNIFTSSKSEDPLGVEVLSEVEGAQLTGGFDHQHAGQDGPVGEVASHPERILPNHMNPGNGAGFRVKVNDPVGPKIVAWRSIDPGSMMDFAGIPAPYSLEAGYTTV